MAALSNCFNAVANNWPIWFLSAALVVAAVIDGWKLKVPNWLTFPLVVGGWIYATACCGGWSGLGWSLLGTAVGLALLVPLYAIGGMGAGDVKLLAGVGAWVGATTTFYAFCLSTVFGGLIAVGMVLYRRKWGHHSSQLMAIVGEILTIRDPSKLSELAAERKKTMLLLPYGIPIALGTIVYFIWTGMLL
jgi:prepilin peptidase CpaA